MTDEITPAVVETPVAAAVEQKSPELVTTDPKTPDLLAEPVVAPVEPVEVKPTAEQETQKRLDDMARESFREKQRADELQRQLEASKPAVKPLGDRPKIDDFKTLEEYDSAIDAWSFRRGQESVNAETAQRQKQEQERARLANVAAKGAASRQKHPDFDTVVRPLAGVMDSSEVLSDFVASHPMGVETAYELAKNPAILEQILNLSRSNPWEARERLIAMGTRLKAPPVAQSNAPEPIKTVGNKNTLPTNLEKLAKEDMNGYVALRNKQELADKTRWRSN
jgi:hypothetical protein